MEKSASLNRGWAAALGTRPPWVALLTALSVIGVDQWSKEWATRAGWVSHNPGISFGWLATQPSLLTIGLGVVLLVAVIGCWRWLLPTQPVAVGVFLGGGVSNWWDRLSQGAVRDWLPLGPWALRNNLADWAISLAVLWWLWISWRHHRRSS